MTRSTLALLVLLPLSCSEGFAKKGSGRSLRVSLVSKERGSPQDRMPISTSEPRSFVVNLRMLDASGAIDTSFAGTVRAAIKPGTVLALSGDGTIGRNVQLVGGVANNVRVDTLAAYGDARIWFEDLGYTPKDPLSDVPPECADNVDNNRNGKIDSPTEPGCAFANDDSESGGTLATGVSDILYFQVPRISDIRGYAPSVPGSGRSTPFPKEQVQIDTGYRGDGFAFSTVVTRIASDGFYVTDLTDDQLPKPTYPRFSSVFAFTFSAPPRLCVCDRLKSLSGTSIDFFGFTELGFPTWTLEEFVPNPSLPGDGCLAPPPRLLSLAPPDADHGDITSTDELFAYQSALARILSEPDKGVTVRVASHLGPRLVPEAGGTFTPGEDASNCDYNGDGSIDFQRDPERACNQACLADPECSEYSEFLARHQFDLVLTRAEPRTVAKFQVNSSAASHFDPLLRRGGPLRSFTGTLRYFSGGGGQFTLEARGDYDVVQNDSDEIRPFDTACALARAASANNESSH